MNEMTNGQLMGLNDADFMEAMRRHRSVVVELTQLGLNHCDCDVCDRLWRCLMETGHAERHVPVGVDQLFEAIFGPTFFGVEAEAPNSMTGGQGFPPCSSNAYDQLKPGETCRDTYGRVFMRMDYKRDGRDWVEVPEGIARPPEEVEAMREEVNGARAVTGNRLPEESEARKVIPLTTGLIDYFPDALAAVAFVSKFGNDKHNPGEPLHHARGKSMDHADCIGRHLVDRGGFDSHGIRHSAQLAWRALANLQEELERDLGLPLPRGAWPA